MTTRGASTLSVDFSSLQEFSIYIMTLFVIVTSGYNATLTPTVEFTTKAAGKNVHWNLLNTYVAIMLMICSTAAPTGPPQSLNSLSTTSRSVSVSWTQIRCIERNGLITNYTVEFQEVGGALIPGVVVNRTFTASGLTPYTNYTFRVAGVNDAGTGSFTDVTSVMTEEESNHDLQL